MLYSIEDAAELVSAARGVIELQTRSQNFDPFMIEQQFERFNKKEKVSIRLIHFPTGTVRGFSESNENYLPMIRAVTTAALSAAFGKHNSIPVSIKEMDELIVEMNIFSEPIQLSGSYVSRRREIEVGKHGIIVNYGMHRSTILPARGLDSFLDTTQFLESAVVAAGLQKDYWKQPKVELYRFTAQRFIEESPNGKVKIL